MVIRFRKKAGRCFNGAERDQGKLIHAVPGESDPSWAKALCGTVPGRKGNGWQSPTQEKANCPKCLRALERYQEGAE